MLNEMKKLDVETEKAVRRFITLVADRYELARAVVYGSRARGTHRPDSDVDVAVLLHNNGPRRFFATKLAMADLAFDVLLETGILVSPLPVWLDEWESPEGHWNPVLLQNIIQEGIKIETIKDQCWMIA